MAEPLWKPDPEKDLAAVGRSMFLKRASEGTPTGVPEVPFFEFPWKSQNFPISVMQTPNEKSIDDLMKIPPDWDYKNPVWKGIEGRGPYGEELPEDALGWTPHATPYYGPGLE